MSESNLIIYSICAIFIASFCGFFIGRQSVYVPESTNQITISDIKIDETILNKTDIVFASKSGTRFYPRFCNGHNNISEKNKIKFESAKIAEKNGYTIAKSCA